MELETFKELIERLDAISKRSSKAYMVGIDLLEYNDKFYSVIKILMTESFGESGADMIDWFCYERDFGRSMSKENPAAWDHNRQAICYDIESLYEYLKSEK